MPTKFGKPYRGNPISGKGKQKKEDKKPLGTKGGKGKPARTYKKGVPHGVDKKDQQGNTIIEVKKAVSLKEVLALLVHLQSAKTVEECNHVMVKPCQVVLKALEKIIPHVNGQSHELGLGELEFKELYWLCED